MPKYVFARYDCEPDCHGCPHYTDVIMPMDVVDEITKRLNNIGWQRVYTPPNVVIYRSGAEYLERAVEGKETVPGLTTEEVRKTVECSLGD